MANNPFEQADALDGMDLFSGMEDQDAESILDNDPVYQTIMTGSSTQDNTAKTKKTKKEKGAMRQAWDLVSQPFKSIAGVTGAMGMHAVPIVPLLAPDRLKKAYQRNLQDQDADPNSIMDRLEALPGAGDVLFGTEEPTSTLGRVLQPAAQIAVNIAGDPTSVVGGVGAAMKAPTLAGKVAQLALRAPVGALAGVAYAPEVAEGIGAGLSDAASAVGRGDYGEAAVGGSQALLMSGLAALMGKGVMDEAKAFKTAVRAGVNPGVAKVKFGQKMAEATDPTVAPEVPGVVEEAPARSVEEPSVEAAPEAVPPTPLGKTKFGKKPAKEKVLTPPTEEDLVEAQLNTPLSVPKLPEIPASIKESVARTEGVIEPEIMPDKAFTVKQKALKERGLGQTVERVDKIVEEDDNDIYMNNKVRNNRAFASKSPDQLTVTQTDGGSFNVVDPETGHSISILGWSPGGPEPKRHPKTGMMTSVKTPEDAIIQAKEMARLGSSDIRQMFDDAVAGRAQRKENINPLPKDQQVIDISPTTPRQALPAAPPGGGDDGGLKRGGKATPPEFDAEVDARFDPDKPAPTSGIGKAGPETVQALRKRGLTDDQIGELDAQAIRNFDKGGLLPEQVDRLSSEEPASPGKALYPNYPAAGKEPAKLASARQLTSEKIENPVLSEGQVAKAAPLETQARVAQEARARKLGTDDLDEVPFTPEQQKTLDDWFSDPETQRNVNKAIKIAERSKAGIQAQDVISELVQRAGRAVRRFKPGIGPDGKPTKLGNMIQMNNTVLNLIEAKKKSSEGKLTKDIEALSTPEKTFEAEDTRVKPGEETPKTKEEDINTSLKKAGYDEKSIEAWLYKEKFLSGEKPLTNAEVAIRLAQKTGTKKVTPQAIQKRMAAIETAIGEKRSKTFAEKPEGLPEGKVLEPRGEGVAPKDYAAANKDALVERLNYLASKGRRETGNELFDIGEALGMPLVDAKGNKRTDSNTKLAGKLYDHMIKNLNMDVKVPEFIAAQRKGSVAVEAKPEPKVEEAPKQEVEAKPEVDEETKRLKAEAKAEVEKRKAARGNPQIQAAIKNPAVQAKIKDARKQVLEEGQGGNYKAVGEGSEVRLRRAGNLWELTGKKGDLDKVIDNLDTALRDVDSFSKGSNQIVFDKNADPIIIKSLEKRGTIKPFVQAGKPYVRGDRRFYDITGLREATPTTIRANGVEFKVDNRGNVTFEKAKAKPGNTMSGGLFLTQESVEKLGEWVSHGAKLLGVGVKEAASWARHMVAHFGPGVKKFLSQVLDFSKKVRDFLAPPSDLPGGKQAGVFMFGGKKETKPEPTKTMKEVVDALPLDKNPPRGTNKVFENVMNRPVDAGSKVGKPGGIIGKGKKRTKVDDVSINTLRHEFSSDEVRRDAVEFFKSLIPDGGERYTKRPWKVVEEESAEILTHEGPSQFIMRIGKRGGNLTDAEAHALGRIITSSMEEISYKKETFFTRMQGEVSDAAEALDDLIFALAKGEAEGRIFGAKKTAMGQALAALRMAKTGVDPQLTKAAKLESYMRDIKIEEKKIKELMETYRTGDVDKFLKDLAAARRPGLVDRGLFLLKATLLTPASLVANTASNLALQAARDIEKNLLAPALDKLLAKVQGREREIFHVPAKLYMASHAQALKEGWGRFVEELGQVARMEPLKPADLGGITDLAVRGGAPIPGKTGEFLASMFKLMDISDAYAKTISLHRELVSRAYAHARKEGKGGDLADRTWEIMGDMRQAINMIRAGDALPDDLKRYQFEWDAIDKAVLADTFQSALEGGFRTVNRMIQGFKPSQLFIPFFKTPANLAIQTYKRTPISLLTTLVDIAKKNPENANKIMAEELAKPILGTMLMGLIGGMAMEGAFTGGGPTDPKKQALLKDTGWQPYSLKLGDTYIPYNRLEPLSSLAGIAADLSEGWKNGDFRKVNKAMERIASTVAENLTNKTFLSGLEGLFTAWHDPKQYGGRLIKQLQGQAIPNTIGFIPAGVLARAFDPVFRETDAFTSSPFQAKIPGASDKLRAQVTPTGRERLRPGNALERLASPFPTTRDKTDLESNVARELVRIDYPPAPPRDTMAMGGVEVDLKEKEVALLRAAHLKATRIVGTIINQSSYKALPDNEEDPRFTPGKKTKKSVLEAVYRRYRAEANKRIKPAAIGRLRKEYGN